MELGFGQTKKHSFLNYIIVIALLVFVFNLFFRFRSILNSISTQGFPFYELILGVFEIGIAALLIWCLLSKKKVGLNFPSWLKISIFTVLIVYTIYLLFIFFSFFLLNIDWHFDYIFYYASSIFVIFLPKVVIALSVAWFFFPTKIFFHADGRMRPWLKVGIKCSLIPASVIFVFLPIGLFIPDLLHGIAILVPLLFGFGLPFMLDDAGVLLSPFAMLLIPVIMWFIIGSVFGWIFEKNRKMRSLITVSVVVLIILIFVTINFLIAPHLPNL